MRRLSLMLVLVLTACGAGGSTDPGGAADVVIIGATTGGVSVHNIGGPGAFYIETWDQSTYNAPGGDSHTLIRIDTSPVTGVSAGYSGTVGVTGGLRYVAKTQVAGGPDYFTSSCWGQC